ncbi:hypothetical protein [Paenibacillus glacialis]|uniref:Uncharacterized protein n=1 Tax=Paenibacillus glacialis TaxID=494026 RepID=A0A168MDC6_9BACL|nr:hypothetical protein [Paenibacillus glacialis]OAB44539.1 hypothetical protein PGLA_07765 [Paenibacillus glacialis]
MDLRTIGIAVFIVSILLTVVFYIWLKLLTRKAERDGTQEIIRSYEQLAGTNKQKWKRKVYQFFQDSYVMLLRVPLIRRYVLKIRKRLQAIHAYDEYTMRRETIKIVFSTISIICVVVIVLIFVNQDFTFIFMVLLAALVVNGMLIDAFVLRVEDRLLIQLRDLLKDVRHNYHQNGMIEEAVHDSAETSSNEAALHAKKIHEVLTSNNSEEKLELYYESAPNRFLKGFAGMSFLVQEYGDKIVKEGSLYLNNLNKLAEEINLEILKRRKLNFLFKGLTAIAVFPILFTKPIENWASNQFPLMGEFYTSKMGFLTKLIIFAIVLGSYVLLKKMQDQQEGTYVSKTRKNPWELHLLKVPGVKWIVDRLTPARRTGEYFKISRLLKDANARNSIEWHYLHRFLLCLIVFVGVLISFSTMHYIAIHNVMTAPTNNSNLFGKMSIEELQNANQLTDFDSNIIYQVKGVNNEQLHDAVVQLVKQDETAFFNETLLNTTTIRILSKIQDINAEYLKWWELLISIVFGGIAYQVPLWILLFQKKMRAMDMQNETDQFHTIVAMLCEIDRMSVEVILEWMERFSNIFKDPLHKCVQNYESGAEKALEQVKLDAPFIPLVRIIERLQLSIDRIPIKQAFDDLETERKFYFDQRKQSYEEMIDAKAGWGRMIGFAPMYAVIFLYLVIPLIYMSFTQIGVYYEQINKL